MANWEMTCTCGEKLQMDGDTAEAAANKLMETAMTPEAVLAHMTEKHASQPVPTQEQLRGGLLASAVAI